MTKRKGVAVGFVLWLVTAFFAFWLAGAGHGWITPLWVTLPGVLLGPLTVVTVFASRTASRNFGLALLAAAAALDLWLLIGTVREYDDGFRAVLHQAPVLAMPWIALWLGWHSVIITNLLKPRPKA